MTDKKEYLPEGTRITTPENRALTGSYAGLAQAMANKTILEAMAVLCENDYSLHVDLGEVHGIIPRNEIAYSKIGEPVKDIAVITRVGKAVCFVVQQLLADADGGYTAILSRKEAQKQCMEAYLTQLSCGDIIPAKVTHMEQFGAFVDVGCGVVSLLSIDCISVSRILHPHDRFDIGMPLKVAVKSIDRESGRMYVTYKELLGTWEENAAYFHIGQTVAGIVRSIEEYGIFVELLPNLAGLAEYRPDITVGQICAVYIKNIVPERMKIKLVLIDSYKGELSPKKLTVPDVGLLHQDVTHLEDWQYSPLGCKKIIRTQFA